MTMKHKHIILHPVNLRECDLIITQTQVRRKVIKVIGRLDPINKGWACKGIGTRYLIRRESGHDIVVDQSPYMGRQIRPRNRLYVFEPLLAT